MVSPCTPSGLLLMLAVGCLPASVEAAAHKANYMLLDAQRLHSVSYDVEAADEIIQLDSLYGLKDIVCRQKPRKDVNSLNLTFRSERSRKKFADAVKGAAEPYITSKSSPCDDGLLMRRVWKVDSPACISSWWRTTCTAVVRTSRARYGELISDGSISISSVDRAQVSEELIRSLEASQNVAVLEGTLDEDLGASVNTSVCLGINTEGPKCDATKQSIDLYSYTMGSAADLKVTCENCFAGISGKIFLDMSFAKGWISSVSAGLKDVVVEASLGVKVDVKADNTFINIDKSIWDGERVELFRFHVGHIPFVVNFEGTGTFSAVLGCDAKGTAEVGVHARHHIGDDYFTWTKASGFKHSKDIPKTTFDNTLVAPNGDLRCHGNIAFNPKAKVAFNDLAKVNLAFNPSAELSITGSAKGTEAWSLCEEATMGFGLETSASLQASLGSLSVSANMEPVSWAKSLSEPQKYCIGKGEFGAAKFNTDYV